MVGVRVKVRVKVRVRVRDRFDVFKMARPAAVMSRCMACAIG